MRKAGQFFWHFFTAADTTDLSPEIGTFISLFQVFFFFFLFLLFFSSFSPDHCSNRNEKHSSLPAWVNPGRSLSAVSQLSSLPCPVEEGSTRALFCPLGTQWTPARWSQQCPGRLPRQPLPPASVCRHKARLNLRIQLRLLHWHLQQGDREHLSWKKPGSLLAESPSGGSGGGVTALTAIEGCHRLIYCFPLVELQLL